MSSSNSERPTPPEPTALDSGAPDSGANGARRVAVRVTKDALRQVRSGHPWIFDGSVTSVRPEGAAGDLAVVFDDRRRFSAIGLYDPDSPIRVKVLHHGDPTPVDDEFFEQRLSAALQRRAALVAAEHTTAFRWVHGENDGLPGLVLDVYADSVVLKLYSAAWFPHTAQVVAAVERVLAPSRVVLRLARSITDAGAAVGLADGTALIGDLPAGPVRFEEHGLQFEADLVHGQKTGHFLDQRENRLLVRGLSAGARVLDVYCCTGGFSVNAAAGGATLVHSVDISAAAVATTRRNMDHNRNRPEVRACHHHQSVGDAATVMEEMRAEGRSFDVVVVDPPSFASRSTQVDGALRAYSRLTRLALDLIEPGGVLVQASCSSRVTAEAFVDGVLGAAESAGRRLGDVLRTGHAIDHPVGFPEGEYLKAVVATVDRS